MIKALIVTSCFILGILFLLLAVVYLWQEKLIFFPEKVPVTYKYTFRQPFAEVFIDAPGGTSLHALHFKAFQPRGVILYFHGNAGSLRTWGYLAEELLTYGYDIFMPDYRGFGKSTGKISPANLYQDAQLIYNQLLQQYPENEIIIFGRSVGSGMATKLASVNNPKLLLLETPFFNFADVAQTHYPFLPVSWLLKYTFRSDKYIKQVKCPVYILHGTADAVVPFRSGEKLARLLNKPQNFIIIEGGGHNNLSSFPAYRQALNHLLN